MNQQRRERLVEVYRLLDTAYGLLEPVEVAETDEVERLPEAEALAELPAQEQVRTDTIDCRSREDIAELLRDCEADLQDLAMKVRDLAGVEK